MFKCCTKWSSVINLIYSAQQVFYYTLLSRKASWQVDQMSADKMTVDRMAWCHLEHGEGILETSYLRCHDIQ
jgi:hypothetical protein